LTNGLILSLQSKKIGAMSGSQATPYVGHWLVIRTAAARAAGSPENRAMSRSLMIWKLKLCLAAVAALLASVMAPQRGPNGQQAKDHNSAHQIAADSHKPKTPVQPPARQPAAADSRDRLSASML
jgi:hypothetical protein